MRTHTVEERVRYVETDRMQVVHHSTYLYWFEVGRTALLASSGYPYNELEAAGTRFPVIEYSCRLVGAADYGDTVRIETQISTLRSRSVVFSYSVFNGDERIAMGMTKHVAVGPNLKPRRMPPPLLDALTEYVEVNSESGNP